MAHQVHQSVGGKARFDAFAPYLGRQVESEQAENTVTVEEQAQAIMMMLASVSKGKAS